MNTIPSNHTLVLGATGKTGARVARQLEQRGMSVRRAGRNADVRFDWNDPSTFANAVRGASGIYLLAPVLRLDFAGIVGQFLDEAERAGVSHVTYLSARGVELAPPEVAHRTVELDLASRVAFTHSIVRPAWFMQNFSEYTLRPIDDTIAVPCGTGAEAFVDVEDIAAVAVATLCNPRLHAGRAYAPTGPEALTFEQVAAHLSVVTGRRIAYRDVDRSAWISAAIQAGMPAEYGEVMRQLTETIADGHGAQPNNDVLDVTSVTPTRFADFASRAVGAWC